jgi:hypothetical protein
MLARLCQHLPPPGMHQTRLYGAYANRTRRARARRGPGAALAAPGSETIARTPSQRERRRQWARLIAKAFEVDPLRCPCGGTMRVVAVILDPKVIRKILLPRPEARAHAPPGG